MEIWKKELFKKKGVVLICPEGQKTVNGIDTGRKATVVGVIKKLPLKKLKEQDIVPEFVEGVETDIIETGEIVALGIQKGGGRDRYPDDDPPPEPPKPEPDPEPDPQLRKGKWRPSPGGVSEGHYKISTATQGGVAKKKGIRYILGNNHVLADSNAGKIGDPIWQPGPADGGTAADEIAKLSEFVYIWPEGEQPIPPPPPPPPPPEPSKCPVGNAVAVMFNASATLLHRKTRLQAIVPSVPIQEEESIENLVDCAIARPNNDDDVLDEIYRIGKVTGTVEPELGMKVKKSGRTSALTEGTITMTNTSVKINFGKFLSYFKGQIITNKISTGGDSSSWVITVDNKVVGMLCAGSPTITVVNKIADVIEALDLDPIG